MCAARRCWGSWVPRRYPAYKLSGTPSAAHSLTVHSPRRAARRPGAPRIGGGGGKDVLYGGAGKDIVSGNAGADLHYGGTGNDRLYGATMSDTLRGEKAVSTKLSGQARCWSR